ncbi:MAG: M81 family metallopeptidase [Hyphomicrobiaceae bacterium]|nr:M81 family metallopeptidase [Hyphomicrobiaceae bacterium]
MKPRILIAGFKHETNTFSKLPTSLESYTTRGLYQGEEMRSAFAGTNTEIAGFLDACERHGWEPVLGAAGDATPSGRVTREAFDTVTGYILDAIERDGPVNAVLIQLHGAMVAEEHDDGESAVLDLIREKVGPDVPIGVTHDLHANVTDRTGELADVLVSYRTYPHIDQHETATICADLIARAMAGEIKPKVTLLRGPQLDGVDHGRTTSPGPMREILALADSLTDEHGLLSASINAGFPWADVDYVGPTVIVVADEGNAGAVTAAEKLREELWRTREVLTINPVTAATALAEGRKKGKVGKPYVIADFADNPGGGGYGDSTGLLRAMIEGEIENAAFASLYDPESVEACTAAGAGAEIELNLGGKVDSSLGSPINVTGTVVGLYEGKFKLEGPMATGVAINIGPAAVFRTGGVDVVLASRRAQNYDQQFFKACGIEPTERAILAVKSAQHFRADYTPIACEIAVVDEGGGITSHNFKSLDYRHVRRPIWPLDDI